MQLENFINSELTRIVKFLIWWNYKISIKEDGFDSTEMSEADWREQLAFFDPESEMHSIPEEYQLEDFGIDALRADLMHQLKTVDDLDWDYFMETAIRAKVKADALGVNMTP